MSIDYEELATKLERFATSAAYVSNEYLVRAAAAMLRAKGDEAKRLHPMEELFELKREWSYKTFGPPERRGPVGPLKHLEKEAREAYEETDPAKRKEEIADCLFLVFDAAHRAGMTPLELIDVATTKLIKNESRTWPDWRSKPADVAIEHERKEGE